MTWRFLPFPLSLLCALGTWHWRTLSSMPLPLFQSGRCSQSLESKMRGRWGIASLFCVVLLKISFLLKTAPAGRSSFRVSLQNGPQDNDTSFLCLQSRMLAVTLIQRLRPECMASLSSSLRVTYPLSHLWWMLIYQDRNTLVILFVF